MYPFLIYLGVDIIISDKPIEL